MPFTFDIPIDLTVKPEKVIVSGTMKGGASAPPISVPFKAKVVTSQPFTKLVTSVETKKYTRQEAEKRVRTALVGTDNSHDIPDRSLVLSLVEALFTDAGTVLTKMLMRTGMPIYRDLIPLLVEDVLSAADRFGYDFDDPLSQEELDYERLIS